MFIWKDVRSGFIERNPICIKGEQPTTTIWVNRRKDCCSEKKNRCGQNGLFNSILWR